MTKAIWPTAKWMCIVFFLYFFSFSFVLFPLALPTNQLDEKFLLPWMGPDVSETYVNVRVKKTTAGKL